jgi:hypothetical protein
LLPSCFSPNPETIRKSTTVAVNQQYRCVYTTVVLWVKEDLLPKHVQVEPSTGEATNIDELTPAMLLWVKEDLLPKHVQEKHSTGEATNINIVLIKSENGLHRRD